jgi:hypothetical protein
MSTNENDGVSFKLYRYTPSLVAAIIFIVVFALATLYHLYQVVRTRSWYFTIFVGGGACEFNRPEYNGPPTLSHDHHKSPEHI